MDIKETTTTAVGRPDAFRRPQAVNQEPTRPHGQQEGPTKVGRGEDRVEISGTGRAAAEAEGRLIRELETARGAMLSLPPLNADQALDILERIEQGDYSQSEVIMQYASRLARDLIVDTVRRESVTA